MWHPGLSLEDYAHLYTIRQLRRKDKKVTDAYCHLIRAQGYSEVLRYGQAAPGASTWCREERYVDRLATALEGLKEALEGVPTDHPFVGWLKVQAEIIDSTPLPADYPG